MRQLHPFLYHVHSPGHTCRLHNAAGSLAFALRYYVRLHSNICSAFAMSLPLHVKFLNIIRKTQYFNSHCNISSSFNSRLTLGHRGIMRREIYNPDFLYFETRRTQLVMLNDQLFLQPPLFASQRTQLFSVVKTIMSRDYKCT